MPKRGEYSTLEAAIITQIVGRTDDPTTELFLGALGGIPSGPESERPVDPGQPMLFYNEDIPAYELWWDPPGVWLNLSEFPIFFAGELNAPTTTTIPANNTWTPVEGVLVPSGIEVGFTLQGAGSNEWLYTGPNREGIDEFHFQAFTEKANGGVPETFEFAWHLNGSPVGSSGLVATRQNEPVGVFCDALLVLNTNDVLVMNCRNITSTDDIIVAFNLQRGGGR